VHFEDSKGLVTHLRRDYQEEVLKRFPYPSYAERIDFISPSWIDEEDLFTPVVSGVSYKNSRKRAYTGLVIQTAIS
jgi:hypothetical protein